MIEHIKYVKEYPVLWRDLDPNQHMRASAYFDYATTARVEALADLSLSMAILLKEGFGPVILKESIEYKREFHLNDILQVGVEVVRATVNKNRWVIRHNIYNKRTGKLSCIIHVDGGWIDIQERKLLKECPTLLNVFFDQLKAEDFKIMGMRDSLQFHL